MVLWGGLSPIPHQVAADIVALSTWTYIACSSTPNVQLLLASCVMTVAVSGNCTNKWTLIFPMVPLILLQLLRRALLPNKITTNMTRTMTMQMTKEEEEEKEVERENVFMIWISRAITVLSVGLILLAAALSVLFPALQLPLPVPVHQGQAVERGEEASQSHLAMTMTMTVTMTMATTPRYHVGVVDLFLPVRGLTFDDHSETGTRESRRQDHVTVRVLYPTDDDDHHQNEKERKNSHRHRPSYSSYRPKAEVPHLRPETASDFCEQTMRHGSPPPLRKFHWMLHNWRLGTLGGTVRRDARVMPPPSTSPSDGGGGWPVVAYSHGLGGSAELYSYQTIALASAGYVVLVVEHADGSAPVITRKDGSRLLRNATVEQVRFVSSFISFGVKRAPPLLGRS